MTSLVTRALELNDGGDPRLMSTTEHRPARIVHARARREAALALADLEQPKSSFLKTL
jgi:hypothetical protein